MMKIFLVKFGGSLITNKSKPFTAREEIIKRLAKEVKDYIDVSKNLVIIGHGGGSYPHVPAVKYKTAEGIINHQSLQGIVEVQDAASRLNRLVIKILLEVGLKAISINPSSCVVTKNGEISKSYIEPLEIVLAKGLLPIVYGDVVMDSQNGCAILSTEKILRHLAHKLQKNYTITRVIHCGTTDGVYDENHKTIPQLDSELFKLIRSQIKGSGGIDVTGGMLHKVLESLMLAKKGIRSVIINGNKKGELQNVLLNKPHHGTVISNG